MQNLSFQGQQGLKSTYPEVRKRDGREIEFDSRRIFDALRKASISTGEMSSANVYAVTGAVVAGCEGKASITVEDIQDLAERELQNQGFYATARAYAVYREQHRLLRADRRAMVNAVSSIDEYLDGSDWRIKANANQNYSIGGLILNTAGKMIANYWLEHVYSPTVSQAHREGDLHVHDLDMLSGYCAGWSLRALLTEGLNGCPGRVEAGPPRHLRTALGQMTNFLGTLQNEWAGAQAFSSFDTYLAPYVRQDGLSYEDVYQCLQEFIYNLNVPSRWGSQPPFTNLTFDWTCPEDIRDQVPLVGGQEVAFTYGDLQAEMDTINRAYLEVMLRGDHKGRIFTFPIPTYNVTKDFPWQHPNAELLFELAGKYGLPYFQNFVNSDLEPHMVRSMCCRLQLDLGELLKRGNGLFGSAEQTGSIGVVTLNCARIGYVHRGDESGMYDSLDSLLEVAYDSLEVKRKFVQDLIDRGFYPYTKRYLGTLRNHFSTIGVNGINECVRNFTEDRHDITTQAGYDMALRMLQHVRQRLAEFQDRSGHMYNLEATPAEGATHRFAREDLKRYPDILQAGTPQAPYYTNSSQLPVSHTQDPFAALSHQEELQRQYTGGTVLHLYLPESIPTAEACKRLVRKSLERFRLPYITITPTFSVCPTHGYISGEHETCPTCGQGCEIWTRVMGYHRPVSSFNRGKQSEFEERVEFVAD